MTSEKSRNPKQKIAPRVNAMTETISGVLGIVPCGRLLGSVGRISRGEYDVDSSWLFMMWARVEYLSSVCADELMVGETGRMKEEQMDMRQASEMKGTIRVSSIDSSVTWIYISSAKSL